ncbi:hypothetical protein SLA2020_153910 [Shorea laevis]
MAPEISLGAFNRVKIDGKNVGAAMLVRRGGTGEPEGCCCINIYVNNNIQGATHTLLLGSSIKMQDPGVHFHFNEGSAESKTWRARLGILGVLLVVFISLLFLSPLLLL